MNDTIIFIFSSFWRWLGALIMLCVISAGASSMFTVRVRNRCKSKDDESTQEQKETKPPE